MSTRVNMDTSVVSIMYIALNNHGCTLAKANGKGKITMLNAFLFQGSLCSLHIPVLAYWQPLACL